MTHPTHNPMHDPQAQAGATFLPYGPSGAGSAEQTVVQIVESFGEYELEYAAIRKGAGILDMPQLGMIELQGNDRNDFLHRFLTNEVKQLKAGEVRRAFLLNNKGRIVADLMVLVSEKSTRLVLDRFDAQQVRDDLENYLFSEDVRITNESDAFMHVAVHGPQTPQLLAAMGADVSQMQPLTHHEIQLHGTSVHVYRFDDAGAPGWHLLLPAQLAGLIYQALASHVGGLVPEVTHQKRPITGRGIGWLAYNTARIEAGTPLFHVDFGPDSLPHETGLIPETVSFTKGCYIGQEIVARMQNLGHPKRIIVGLAFDDDRMPIAGGQVADKDDATQIVGAVSSSTLSPLRGNNAIAFATVKWGRHTAGTELRVSAEGELVPAKVHALKFV